MKTSLHGIFLILTLSTGGFADIDKTKGLYRQKNYSAALDEYENLARKGNREAKYRLGVMLFNGEGAEKDEKLAVSLWKEAAEGGFVEAMEALGDYYAFGNKESRDETEAARWWKQCAEKDNAECQFLYGIYLGKFQDYAAGAQLLRKAADQGHGGAASMLGSLYLNGKLGPPEPATAARWYRIAAEKGIAEAQYRLGTLYAEGQGVPQNVVEALTWWTKAAEQGYASAQALIGSRYLGQQNHPEAFRWLQRAAKQGDMGGQLMLAMLYATGAPKDKVPQKNLVQAHMWSNLAAAQGLQEAVQVRGALAAKMTHAEIEKAQALAAAFVPKIESAVAITPERAHQLSIGPGH